MIATMRQADGPEDGSMSVTRKLMGYSVLSLILLGLAGAAVWQLWVLIALVQIGFLLGGQPNWSGILTVLLALGITLLVSLAGIVHLMSRMRALIDETRRSGNAGGPGIQAG
ncbi:hypothetical protein TPR58_14750 [Sphingomonas sp. HF-S3]|uniref:Integral membrane protein n=1 Tax=Sphingomonas rustica TaxID=3103142 RepID=A0ABV0BB21_9SPHN